MAIKSISPLCRLFDLIERFFWICAGLLAIVGAFGMLAKGMFYLVEDFGKLKAVLTKEFFYAVICFELFQMARIRIERRSHKMVLYHFIFMATLTFGREIFLIHNLSFWIVAGFATMVAVYVFFYRWREKYQDTPEG